MSQLSIAKTQDASGGSLVGGVLDVDVEGRVRGLGLRDHEVRAVVVAGGGVVGEDVGEEVGGEVYAGG